MRLRCVAGLLGCPLWSAYAAGPVAAQVGHPAIKLMVDGKPSDVFDQAALAAMPQATVTAALAGEPPGTWQGVALEDIVRRACVASGDALAGRALARLVRVTAANGDQVVFSAAELDPDFGNVQVILADRKDGKPLTEDVSFRLVVPKDKRGDRWLRHVTTIEVMDASGS